MLKLLIFLALSVALTYVSRHSLLDPRSHGFYRFIAWELILALFILNFADFGQWFGDSLSIRQLASWTLLIASILPGVLGVHALITLGDPATHHRNDKCLYGLEKTSRLVTSGVFKYIRHPLYSSLLLLAWGVYLKNPSWIGAGLALGATASLLATAKVEEAENIRYFGAAYQTYMRQTKRFLPLVF